MNTDNRQLSEEIKQMRTVEKLMPEQERQAAIFARDWRIEDYSTQPIDGEERYLLSSDYKILDESDFGTLICKQIARSEPLVMVRVKNSTPESDGTHKYYYLRVPPQTATAREGVAWTFGMDADDYELVQET